ncbi:MAG: hypothetical protein N2447_00980 [Thermoanaerobaculum sp.]|nr:hypothetical protein [Thermoanaerobaculum sp.]
MSEDTRRLMVVALLLVLGLGVVLLAWQRRESLRPKLVRVDVVFLVQGEDVAREEVGVRGADEDVWAGVLLAYQQGKRPVRLLSPFPKVFWQGEEVHPEPLQSWPRSYGVLRAQWFTLEPAFFGWEGVDASTAEKLAFAEFLAAEMGNELQALVTKQAHNDDFLAQPVAGNLLEGGIQRLKVKVGVYTRPEDLLPWASVASPGVAELSRAATLRRGAPLPEGIHPNLARAFRLGVFTFAPGVWPDGGPDWPLPLSPREMVAQWRLMTPQAVAALAAGGDPLAEPWDPPEGLVARGDRWERAAGGAVRWGEGVKTGDAFHWAGRWAVAWGDDGNGVLDFPDQVLVAWQQPPYLATLAKVASVTQSLQLRRVMRELR